MWKTRSSRNERRNHRGRSISAWRYSRTVQREGFASGATGPQAGSRDGAESRAGRAGTARGDPAGARLGRVVPRHCALRRSVRFARLPNHAGGEAEAARLVAYNDTVAKWYEIAYVYDIGVAQFVSFPRPLYPPDDPDGPVEDGPDVEAVKRAVSRLGRWPWPGTGTPPAAAFDNAYSNAFAHGKSSNVGDSGVTGVQRQANVAKPSGAVGERTYDVLLYARVPKGCPRGRRASLPSTPAQSTSCSRPKRVQQAQLHEPDRRAPGRHGLARAARRDHRATRRARTATHARTGSAPRKTTPRAAERGFAISRGAGAGFTAAWRRAGSSG